MADSRSGIAGVPLVVLPASILAPQFPGHSRRPLSAPTARTGSCSTRHPMSGTRCNGSTATCPPAIATCRWRASSLTDARTGPFARPGAPARGACPSGVCHRRGGAHGYRRFPAAFRWRVHSPTFGWTPLQPGAVTPLRLRDGTDARASPWSRSSWPRMRRASPRAPSRGTRSG